MPENRNQITPHLPANRSDAEGDYRQPKFECHDGKSVVDLDVFVPGVERDGVDLELDGGRLVVTAHKPALVTTNWQPANLGAAQRDYQLQLRLPRWVKKERISADLDEGVLHIYLQKARVGAPANIKVA